MKLLLSVILVGAAGAGWYAFDNAVNAQAAGGPSEASQVAVQRSDLVIQVSEKGYLKAKNSVKLAPEFRGEGTITWLIEEGETVKEGDILVEFEKKEIQSRIDEIDSQIVQAEVALEGSRATLLIQERDTKAAVKKAELAQEIAVMTLAKWAEGEDPNQLSKLRHARDRASREFDRAEDHFKSVPALAKEGFFTEIEVAIEELKVQEKEIAKESAINDLHLYEEYTRKMEKKQKNAAVEDADRDLINARDKADISLNEKRANISRQEGALEALKVRLDKYKKDLDKMTIKAPQDGIVHLGDPRNSWYRERIKVGGQVYRGNTLITLPDLKEMEVMIKIHEADIDKVDEEQIANITLDTYPGKIFTGKVTDIASVATSSGWDDNTKAFNVTVLMDASETELRAGISAKVEVQVATLTDALHIPLQCVYVEEGEHLAFIVEDGDVKRRTLKVGRNNIHRVEVLEGLSEGEQVLLYDPRESGSGDGKDKHEEETEDDTMLPTAEP
ncbi:MAG: HlyD family secretion protein [Planctomycetota bacterium]|jgi:HlyD family secretion protein